MEQLTLEQAATNYAPLTAERIKRESFKAGAEWQKEQIREIFKQLLPILKEAFFVCLNEGQDDVVERAEAFIDQLQLNE